jgi:nitroreductase
MMKNLDFILKRRSCRDFSGEPLKKGDLNILLEALRRAPSAGNAQPWFFYIIKNEKIKKGLAEAAYGQNFLVKATVVFLVCTISRISSSAYGKRGKSLYCIQDTAAAVENLLIAATALGYGSCWIGAFDEMRVRNVMNIPEHMRPVAIVPVGPGSIPSGEPLRREVSEISAIID